MMRFSSISSGLAAAALMTACAVPSFRDEPPLPFDISCIGSTHALKKGASSAILQQAATTTLARGYRYFAFTDKTDPVRPPSIQALQIDNGRDIYSTAPSDGSRPDWLNKQFLLPHGTYTWCWRMSSNRQDLKKPYDAQAISGKTK